jgi:glycosyltransferase involved in cell wall biosynthesis
LRDLRRVPSVDVLIPTYRRPAALAVTLATLAGQDARDFRVVVSDQSEDAPSGESGEVAAVLRILRAHGHEVELHRHLPRRGLAEQRDFLLARARAPRALFVDDDVFLEPWTVRVLVWRLRHAAVRRLSPGTADDGRRAQRAPAG